MNYRQVFIRTEEDLPKVEGDYFCNRSGFLSVQHLILTLHKTYMREIRWYLEPIPEAKKSAEACNNDCKNVPSDKEIKEKANRLYGPYVMLPRESFIDGAKWMREQIKQTKG